jgi:hypothetical protein
MNIGEQLAKHIRDDIIQAIESVDPEDWIDDAADYEIDRVCTFLRRFDVAQFRGCSVPALSELIDMLARKEHRR